MLDSGTAQTGGTENGRGRASWKQRGFRTTCRGITETPSPSQPSKGERRVHKDTGQLDRYFPPTPPPPGTGPTGCGTSQLVWQGLTLLTDVLETRQQS